MLKVLACGDVVGRPGRDAVRVLGARILTNDQIDVSIINAENAAGGLGIDENSALEMQNAGANVVTLGDHTFHKKDFGQFLEANCSWCLRPANYPTGTPGRGWTIVRTKNGTTVGVMNLMGRVFMNASLDCPFRAAESILSGPLRDCDCVVVDFHAEASSEKCAMGRFLDGKASLVVGTHTHVQTADEQIFEGGTGFISDLGMCGCRRSVIGMQSDIAWKRFYTGMPHGYRLAEEGPRLLQGVIAELDGRRTHTMRRVQETLLP